ncbi:MAG: 3-hydroxyacyl-CoA dehydrogenase family protein [Pseudomonadota bacterium]
MTQPIAPLQDLFWQACEDLLIHHTNPWELDEALVAWGYGFGPCEAQDLAGLDAVLQSRTGSAPHPILARMVAEGRLGKKVGWGYFRYPGGGGAVVDPLIEDLIHEEARFARITRVELEGSALVERLHSAIGPALFADVTQAARLVHFPVARIAAS